MNRTITQNGSLHLYCTQLAEALNDNNYDQKKLLNLMKEGVEIPNTMESIKQLIQIFADAMYHENHTSKLSTVQLIEVYKVFDKNMSMITGVSVAWPSKDALMEECLNKNNFTDN